MALVTPILLFPAFLLLLFASLSGSFIKSSDFFRIVVHAKADFLGDGRGDGSINMGAWGYCVSPIKTYNTTVSAYCSKKSLGYTLDQSISTTFHLPFDLITKSRTSLLVLHPIASWLTLGALIGSIFVFKTGLIVASRIALIYTISATLLAMVAATVAFVNDAVIVTSARAGLFNVTGGFEVSISMGDAIWMTLAAMILLWVTMILYVCDLIGLCSMGSKRKSEPTRGRGHARSNSDGSNGGLGFELDNETESRFVDAKIRSNVRGASLPRGNPSLSDADQKELAKRSRTTGSGRRHPNFKAGALPLVAPPRSSWKYPRKMISRLTERDEEQAVTDSGIESARPRTTVVGEEEGVAYWRRYWDFVGGRSSSRFSAVGAGGGGGGEGGVHNSERS